MRLIEVSNDYRSKDMTENDLLKAIDMFFGLPDPFNEDDGNPQGCLIRFGASQFDYNRETRHLLPRTLLIYQDLWGTCTSSSKVNVEDAIQHISGLTLKELLVLGFAFSGRAENGFFRWYDEKAIDKLPDTLKGYFTLEKQESFTSFIACNYKNFRTLLEGNPAKSSDYEKFCFNPLLIKPAIIPDRRPDPFASDVYITPIPSLILDRVTRGLYFLLSEYFMSDKGNPFRGAFGSVFQEYVGMLLKHAFGIENVYPEWNYGSKKASKDTPDWFVVLNGQAVVIEVKQSGLFLNSKTWGELESIQRDLVKSIGSGIDQIWEFEQDIVSGLCPVPSWLNGIPITERLIVTYDRSYFLNSILRNEIVKLNPALPTDYHWHTIAVEELEYFLGIVQSNFVDALKDKRTNPDTDNMDFKDYYSSKYSEPPYFNSHLDSVFDQFFSGLDIPLIPAKIE